MSAELLIQPNTTLNKSWIKIRKYILQDIIFEAMIPTPNLTTTEQFELYSVFVKKNKVYYFNSTFTILYIE